jgi:hypothetical protein
MSGSEDLRTLFGETQRIATEALSQGTLSKEDLLAAVVLLKVQRNDARKDAETFRALLERADRNLSIGTDGNTYQPSGLAAEIRAALRVTP